MPEALSAEEFDVLRDLNLGREFKALESVSNVACIERLKKAGLVNARNAITRKGVAALKPYKVSNAVIMAAGMSSRFAPLSYEKPKGVLKVKGEVLVERQIQQLQEVGIKDITLVVGYKQEEFSYLKEKFGVNIVVNEDYYRYNNTSTLIRVLDKLDNTYICSSDNYFTENVFEPYVYHAYYAATYYPGPANEWGIRTNASGRIVGIDHSPVDMWCMMGHVYFDRTFSKAFKSLLVKQYENAAVKENLWEWLFERNVRKLDLQIRKYSSDVIKEFDSLAELRAFDKRYVHHSGSRIFRNICKVLDCRESEIDGIEVLKQGLTNLSFKFTVGKRQYVYRHPGIGTESYISRKSEAFSLGVAQKLGLDPTIVHIDPKKGWKISTFINEAHILDYHNSTEVKSALSLMRRLHEARVPTRYAFDIWEKTSEFISKTDSARQTYPDYARLERQMAALYEFTRQDGVKPILCHCDCYAPNFLVDSRGNMALIDWEYSGASDPGVDIGTFICCSDYTRSQADEVIGWYHGHKPSFSELRHDYAYIALAAYYWFVWAVYQESIGNPVGEYLNLWHRMAKSYLKISKAYYCSERDKSWQK